MAANGTRQSRNERRALERANRLEEVVRTFQAIGKQQDEMLGIRNRILQRLSHHLTPAERAELGFPQGVSE